MKRILGSAFLVVGAFLVFLAAFASIAAAISFSERIRFGPGLMFADVEILAVLAFFLGVAGGVLFWFGRRLARSGRPNTD